MCYIDPNIVKQEKVTSLTFLCVSSQQPQLDAKAKAEIWKWKG